MSKNDIELRQEAQAYIAEHMHDIAEEIIEWNKTGLLRDGRLREAAIIMEPSRGDESITFVEKWSITLMLQFVMDNRPEPSAISAPSP